MQTLGNEMEVTPQAPGVFDVFLASASPRRQELLNNAGVSHVVYPSSVDETLDADTLSNPAEAAKALAERKARAVVEEVLNAGYEGMAAFIGSDTIVALGSTIYGKPADEEDAERMLRELSGKTHSVITGVSVWLVDAAPLGDSGTNGNDSSETSTANMGIAFRTFHDESQVSFKDLSSEDIWNYIATGEPFDKAGSYAIQGEGARLIERYQGNLDTIIGLPVKRLLNDFKEILLDANSGRTHWEAS